MAETLQERLIKYEGYLQKAEEALASTDENLSYSIGSAQTNKQATKRSVEELQKNIDYWQKKISEVQRQINGSAMRQRAYG